MYVKLLLSSQQKRQNKKIQTCDETYKKSASSEEAEQTECAGGRGNLWS